MKNYLTPAETAKLIRRALKDSFPGTKFFVRTDTYAGGSSVRVRWTDGPARAAVERVAGRFAGSGFDGMRDLKYSRGPIETPEGPRETLLDFVFCDRVASPEAREDARRTVAARWGIDLDATPEHELRNLWVDQLVPQRAPHETLDTLVHRELEARASVEEAVR